MGLCVAMRVNELLLYKMTWMKICKHKWLPALWPRLSEFERETYSIYADRSLESDDRWVGIRVARGLLGYWLCSITWAEMVVLQLCSVQIIIWAIRSCFVHFSVASFLNRKIIGNRKKKRQLESDVRVI